MTEQHQTPVLPKPEYTTTYSTLTTTTTTKKGNSMSEDEEKRTIVNLMQPWHYHREQWTMTTTMMNVDTDGTFICPPTNMPPERRTLLIQTLQIPP